MIEMQIRLREAETEALRAKTEMELQLREKDKEIAKILGETKTNVYELQLRDIQSQEAGLDDKIAELQRELVEAERAFAPLAEAYHRLSTMRQVNGIIYNANLPEHIALYSRLQHLRNITNEWIKKRDDFTKQKQEIYRKMGAV